MDSKCTIQNMVNMGFSHPDHYDSWICEKYLEKIEPLKLGGSFHRNPVGLFPQGFFYAKILRRNCSFRLGGKV